MSVNPQTLIVFFIETLFVFSHNTNLIGCSVISLTPQSWWVSKQVWTCLSSNVANCLFIGWSLSKKISMRLLSLRVWTMVRTHFIPNCYEVYHSWAEYSFHPNITSQHEANNDIPWLMTHITNSQPKSLKLKAVNHLMDYQQITGTIYIHPQLQNCNRHFIYISSYPVMPQHIYLSRLSHPKSFIMKYIAIDISFSLAPL